MIYPCCSTSVVHAGYSCLLFQHVNMPNSTLREWAPYKLDLLDKYSKTFKKVFYFKHLTYFATFSLLSSIKHETPSKNTSCSTFCSTRIHKSKNQSKHTETRDRRLSMARINIDDDLRADPRFHVLCTLIPRHIAYGSLICLWELGQAYWKKEESFIPRTLAEQIPNISELVRAGFAVQTDQGIYCAGSKERWWFLKARSEAGKKSAEKRREKYGSAIPQNATNNRTKTEHEPNKTEQSDLILSDTDIILNKNNKNICRTERPTLSLLDGSKKSFPELFETIWSLYPNKDGKKSAKRSFLSTVKTESDWDSINNALTNYQKSENYKKGFIKNGSTWFANWQDWVNFHGIDPEQFKKQSDQNDLVAYLENRQ